MPVTVVPMPVRSGSTAMTSAIPSPTSAMASPSADEDVARRGRVHVEVGDGGHGDRAGQLTRRVTAHAVGHQQQRRTGVAGVLVALADQADVGAGRVAQVEGHGGLLLDLQRRAADPQRGARRAARSAR